MRFLHRKPIILASASPRRAEILSQIGLAVEIIPGRIVETPRTGEPAGAYVVRLATEKASAVARMVPTGLVIGVDTEVVVDGQIMGKPSSLDEARTMLRKLSGREHSVMSGLAVVERPEGRTVQRSATTRVRFKPLTDAEIDAYVASGEPMDKAGAYGIQGLAGLFVEELSGCYYNVVGLPLNLMYETLVELGLEISVGRPGP